jgi:hypothetical protein
LGAGAGAGAGTLPPPLVVPPPTTVPPALLDVPAITVPPDPGAATVDPDALEPPVYTYTYLTGAGAGGSLTITLRVILRTTSTGRRPPFATSTAGFGEAPSAANGARNARPPVTHAQIRSARRDALRRTARSV